MQQKLGLVRGIANNYRFVRVPEHPRANPEGYITEHVLVAERALGRFLRDGVEVHHVNRLRWDNRNANLVICQDRSYHRLLHMRAEALKVCGHAEWRKCKFCKEYSPVGELVTGYVRSNGYALSPYHQRCQTLYRREQRQRAA